MKIMVSGITYTGSKNYENILNKINETKHELLNSRFEVIEHVYSYQAENYFHKLNFNLHDLVRTYYGFKNIQIIFGAKKLTIFLRHLKNVIFSKNKRSGIKYAWRQLNLTNKHIFIWQNFLESDAEYLFVLEDDVIINPKSTLNLSDIFLIIEAFKENYLFVNLINHFDLKKLEIPNNKIVEVTDVYLTKLVANTTGAYIINKNLGNAFFELILKNPRLRAIGADWLITILGSKISRDLNPIAINLNEGIFLNGSLIFDNSQLAS
jgi:hypothetical protein